MNTSHPSINFLEQSDALGFQNNSEKVFWKNSNIRKELEGQLLTDIEVVDWLKNWKRFSELTVEHVDQAVPPSDWYSPKYGEIIFYYSRKAIFEYRKQLREEIHGR